ncbi:MAG: hypothetical protein ACI9TH_004560 [Kiritimatiellia bacterium]|jgi:hypothetical protein
MPNNLFATGLFSLALIASVDAQQKHRPYNLHAVDLKQPVIWGAESRVPTGHGISFGGQDQSAEDGRPHTREWVGGEWKAIHLELREKNALQGHHEQVWMIREAIKRMLATARNAYFEGVPANDHTSLINQILPSMTQVVSELSALSADDYTGTQANRAIGYLRQARGYLSTRQEQSQTEPLQAIHAAQIQLERASEALDAEPAARAMNGGTARLSEGAKGIAGDTLIYDPKTKLYVLFGGDHLDYLSNDTWVFDPAQRKWFQRHPRGAPPPRANHRLEARGDGSIRLSGGYTYTSNTDYCGGQYCDLDDGDWIYDIEKDTWRGGTLVAPDSRMYRNGPFHPDFYLTGPPPDRATFQAWLENLPTNTWMPTDPPQLPQLNRDWGSAIIDPERDLILRFSGGHSAHGGTDVLHYHMAANRWELSAPVEFPLGQLYSNTSYPAGYNFNRRPWVTGHTYQSYGYDPVSKHMLFTGQRDFTYQYDPAVGDWIDRKAKPPGMNYDSAYYTLTLCPTPKNLYAWTAHGELYRYDSPNQTWEAVALNGEKLPGSVVDNSTMLYDSLRHRLLLFSKAYGDAATYDGIITSIDLATRTVSHLSPKGVRAAAAIPYLCQLRYDIEHDLVLVGATLSPEDPHRRRTPAYDGRNNAWVTLKLDGEDPNGKKGRNVSLGLMYDARRKLFWAVDTNSRITVLRLDPATADMQALE